MDLLMDVDEISESYQPKYEAVKGDIYNLQGDFVNAQIAYQKVLDKLSPGNFDYDFIKMKANEIGLDETIEEFDES